MGKKATQPKHPPVDQLYKLGHAFWQSGVLLAALRLGIFDELERQPLTSDQLAKHLKAQKHSIEKFLQACLRLDLVTEADGKYGNSPLTSTFLVRGKPAFQGELMQYFGDLWTRFGELDHLIKQGEIGPLERAVQEARTEAEQQRADRTWVLAMHNIAMSGQADALCAAVDLSTCERLLDVGGGSGTYAVRLAQKYPALIAEVLDSEEITTVARELVNGSDVADRIQIRAGDFVNDAYGTQNQAVLFSGVLHGFDETRVKRLLKKGLNSLVPGGIVIVQEMLASPSSKKSSSSPFPELFGLNMMSGGTYTADQFTHFFTSVGLVDIQIKPLKGGAWFDHVLLGRKPADN